MTQNPLRLFLIAIAFAGSVATLPAEDSPRERLLFDFGWKFHLGDAPDAGNKFYYPEVADLSKTRLDQIGQEGDADDPITTNSGSDVSFIQPGFRRQRLADIAGSAARLGRGTAV